MFDTFSEQIEYRKRQEVGKAKIQLKKKRSEEMGKRNKKNSNSKGIAI